MLCGGGIAEFINKFHDCSLVNILAQISLELAQIVVAEEGGEVLPSWYMVEVVRDLPRLIEKRPDPKQ